MTVYAPKPMDHERLAMLRERERIGLLMAESDTPQLVAELIGDRDHHAAEVARLRARVRVEAEDVKRAGVTRAKLEAWCVANDKFSEGAKTAAQIAYLLHGWWREANADQWRILDEMAAMEAQP